MTEDPDISNLPAGSSINTTIQTVQSDVSVKSIYCTEE